MNPFQRLQEWVELRGQESAIVSDKQSWSFRQLLDRVSRMSRFWQTLPPGQPVGVLIPVSADLSFVLLSLMTSGHPIVLADPAGGLGRLVRYWAMAGVTKVVSLPIVTWLPWIIPSFRKFHFLKVKHLKVKHPDSDFAVPLTNPSQPALLTFTSGSTGDAKAISRNLNFLEIQQKLLVKYLKLESGRVCLPALPAFILSEIEAGCTVVLPHIPGGHLPKVDYQKTANLMKSNRVDHLLASPYFVLKLSEASLKYKIVLPDLKDIFTGGGPVTPGLVTACQNTFPVAEFHGLYGSSEAEPIAHISGKDLLKNREKIAEGLGLLAGSPIPEIQVKILKPTIGPLDFSGQHVPSLPTGKIGEIIVCGNHVNPTYLYDQAAVKDNKIPDSQGIWHRTGDAGYLDEEGRIWLCGRLSQRVAHPGGDLYPFCLEEALRVSGLVHDAALVTHQNISYLAVVGVADFPRLLESIKDLTSVSINVVQVKSIPKDARHHTKVDVKKLRSMAVTR